MRTTVIAPLASPDVASVTNAFITYALQTHDVKRFVLLTGSTRTKGSELGDGKVWSYLDELKSSHGVEYAVLAGTWFMGSFVLTFILSFFLFFSRPPAALSPHHSHIQVHPPHPFCPRSLKGNDQRSFCALARTTMTRAK